LLNFWLKRSSYNRHSGISEPEKTEEVTRREKPMEKGAILAIIKNALIVIVLTAIFTLVGVWLLR